MFLWRLALTHASLGWRRALGALHVSTSVTWRNDTYGDPTQSFVKFDLINLAQGGALPLLGFLVRIVFWRAPRENIERPQSSPLPHAPYATWGPIQYQCCTNAQATEMHKSPQITEDHYRT